MLETLEKYLRQAAMLLSSLIHTLFACIGFLVGLRLEQTIKHLHAGEIQSGTFMDYLTTMGPPLWLPGVLCSFFLGCLLYFFSRSRTALLAWLLPGIILAWNIITWPSNGSSVWDNYFGADCGNSECLYELFVTTPFYACVAYSLGALTVHLFVKPKELPNPV